MRLKFVAVNDPPEIPDTVIVVLSPPRGGIYIYESSHIQELKLSDKRHFRPPPLDGQGPIFYFKLTRQIIFYY